MSNTSFPFYISRGFATRGDERPVATPALTSVSAANSALCDTLREYGRRGILMIRPGGNHGDFLIYRGAKALCARLGLGCRKIDWSGSIDVPVAADELVYVHGSGGLNSWCSGRAFDVLAAALATHHGVVVLGPSTISGEPTVLRERLPAVLHGMRAREVILFARERTTYELLRPLAGGRVRVALDHDTALYASAEALDVVPVRGKYLLYSIRTDRESALQVTERPWWWIDTAIQAPSFDAWVKLHAAASAVITDRTHSAVLASNLGKEVYLIPGAYHKNEAIFRYSLEQRGVRLLGEPRTPALARLVDPIPLLRRGVYSYRLSQWWFRRVMRLAGN